MKFGGFVKQKKELTMTLDRHIIELNKLYNEIASNVSNDLKEKEMLEHMEKILEISNDCTANAIDWLVLCPVFGTRILANNKMDLWRNMANVSSQVIEHQLYVITKKKEA